MHIVGNNADSGIYIILNIGLHLLRKIFCIYDSSSIIFSFKESLAVLIDRAVCNGFKDWNYINNN